MKLNKASLEVLAFKTGELEQSCLARANTENDFLFLELAEYFKLMKEIYQFELSLEKQK